jgi:hypothetical protein
MGGSGPEPPDPMPGKMKAAKHTLLEGIQQAQKENGPAISAKFEFEDGKLMLSVYTAKAGLERDAEHNVLMELNGEATKPKWEPKSEVFEDKEHLARSAEQLTLMQLTPLTLEDATKKAIAMKKGTVYSVIPMVKDGKTVFDVIVATGAGKSAHIAIDETNK